MLCKNLRMMMVYGIPHCDTVKKARAWLASQGVAHQFHDFKKSGVSAELITSWIEAVGWETLLNRRGTTWRQLDPSAQAAVRDASSAQALMQSQPSVIKRPVVQWSDGLTVGFDAAIWAARIGR